MFINNKRTLKKLFIAVILSFAVIVSCKKGADNTISNNNSNNCTGTVSFSADVNPVIQNICATSGCHNATSTNGPGPLTTYQQVFNARASVRAAVASGTMPQNTTLTTTQKNAILCWIDNGANNN
jgi:hypothetical protein